jgi:hypothetical protein
MTRLLAFLLIVSSCWEAQAACPATLPLQGIVDIKHCDAASPTCAQANEALYAYMKAKPDDGPEVLFIATHGSPWHLYDQEYRILEIDDLADVVRQQGPGIKRIKLVASWSGVAPAPRSTSLARQLSTALGGKPVAGQDGFVWVTPQGAVHTTHQALTNRLAGPYRVDRNDDVMASLVPGWTMDLEAGFTKERDAAGLLMVGAAKEIFMLCPDAALTSYEESAALNNPVAAFNAAIIRLERNHPGDRAAALALLKQAAAQGDRKAEKKVQALMKTTPAG